MNTHLTAARSCSWYGKGKLRDLGILDNNENDIIQPTTHSPVLANSEDDNMETYDPQQDSDIFDTEFGPYGEEFHFLPNAEPDDIPEDPEVGLAGPGPSTAANQIIQGATNAQRSVLDDEDIRVTVEDKEAGRIYRQDPPPTYISVEDDEDGDIVMGNDGEPNPFAPFSSELDWKVAQWAVKDGPGHNAFDRLLAIPGVGNFVIFSSIF